MLHLMETDGPFNSNMSAEDRVPGAGQQVILVPIEDFSGRSSKAMQYAIPFAKQFEARIILLKVLPVHYAPKWQRDPVSQEWTLDARVQHGIEKQLADLAQGATATGIPVEIEVRFGVPSTEIVDLAREMEAAMIIMSTQAPKGLWHLFVGSVTSRVARLASCPVLVVRDQENKFCPDQPGSSPKAHSFIVR